MTDERKIPETLEEAVDILIADNKEQEDKLKDMGDHLVGTLHHGFGTGIRNAWGLWYNETPIAKWFAERNIFHGDDRSGIILEAFKNKLNGEPIDWEKTNKRYKEHWKKYGFKDGIFKNEKDD